MENDLIIRSYDLIIRLKDLIIRSKTRNILWRMT
jgi:hypothetical protein